MTSSRDPRQVTGFITEIGERITIPRKHEPDIYKTVVGINTREKEQVFIEFQQDTEDLLKDLKGDEVVTVNFKFFGTRKRNNVYYNNLIATDMKILE